jgi:hypothetical protein
MHEAIDSRRLALEAVLRSKTFDRSEQLKVFLRYICERQMDGRAAELTEYAIGVDVLGRGAEFSPTEDSIVRNRAYALRRKLEEYYEHEGAGEPVRVEIPKGSYAPRFVDAASAPAPPQQIPRRDWLAGAVGLAAGAAGMRLALSSRLLPTPDDATREFWGPVLSDPGKVVLCVGTPAQSFLRTLPIPDPGIRGTLPVDPAVEDWFSKQKVERNGPYLIQVPTSNSPLWGDAAGATRVAQFLALYGIESDLMAERVVALPALRNRNVVFLATTEYSSAAVRLMKGLPLGIQYSEPDHDHIPVRFNAAGAVVERFPVNRTAGSLTTVYGLITRLKGDGDDQRSSQYLILSGVTSAGILAAAEYVTSAHHLSALQAKIGPLGDAPLQVLIRVRADKTLPLSFEYVRHFVGEAK